jgi:hypothetical protein
VAGIQRRPVRAERAAGDVSDGVERVADVKALGEQAGGELADQRLRCFLDLVREHVLFLLKRLMRDQAN